MVDGREAIERAATDEERRSAYLDAIVETPLNSVGRIAELREAFRAGTRPSSAVSVVAAADEPVEDENTGRRSPWWRVLWILFAIGAVIKIVRLLGRV